MGKVEIDRGLIWDSGKLIICTALLQMRWGGEQKSIRSDKRINVSDEYQTGQGDFKSDWVQLPTNGEWGFGVTWLTIHWRVDSNRMQIQIETSTNNFQWKQLWFVTASGFPLTLQSDFFNKYEMFHKQIWNVSQTNMKGLTNKYETALTCNSKQSSFDAQPSLQSDFVNKYEMFYKQIWNI